MFKGYIQTKNKRPLGNIIPKQLSEVLSCEEYAGVLEKDMILIDVDNKHQSDILFNIIKDLNIKCRVYETTRGKHFLFKNTSVDTNKIHCKLAVGITADIKVGKKTSYMILKFDGRERRILYDAAELDNLPKWLLPVKTNLEFVGMSDGDGRNQALFNYILILQGYNFSKKEIKLTINLINRYVFNIPLSDEEIETITRDDAFKKQAFFKGNSFLFDNFAMFIKNNHNIIKLDGHLHIYKDGVYVKSKQDIELAMIKHIPSLTQHRRKEVLSYLNLIVEDELKNSVNLIPFKNGVFNLKEEKLYNFSEDYIVTNKINYNYDTMSYSRTVDIMLNKLTCGDGNLRLLLEEMIGYCFYRSNRFDKAFILTGDKSNGKSTFIYMLNKLLGDENVSNLDLKELNRRFKNAELYDKLANLGDDIDDQMIVDTSIFKKLSTGDAITVERKGQDPFQFRNYATLIFSANMIPQIKDPTGAVQKRLVIIPFNAKFNKDDKDYDPHIKEKLNTDESMEYLILLGLQGLKRLVTNKAFTTIGQVDKYLKEFEEVNNPVIEFLKTLKVENEPTETVFKLYKEFCACNDVEPLNKIQFSRMLCKNLKLKTKVKNVKGKVIRIYVRRG